MHRRSALALFLVAVLSGCGDGGSGSDAGSDDAGDSGDSGDGGGDGPDGSIGPGEPADGQFTVVETHFGEDVFQTGNAFGSILDPRPRYHLLEDSAGACQMWELTSASCDPCLGICDVDGNCVVPDELSAGDVTVEAVGWSTVMRHQDYGYYPTEVLPTELYAEGDEVALTAAGGGDVAAFSLSARGAEPIAMELERGQPEGDLDMLRIEDGADFELTWSPVVSGTRVRLAILSNNRGHGLPVDVFIECEADDTGRMVVPRALVEAFPDKPYQNACAGSDCPPSSLMRFRADRVEIGGRDIELRVGSQRQFIMVHEAR